MAMPRTAYPVQFSVDYPDRSLNRLTSAFRIFVAIPILIVLGSVSGGAGAGWYSSHGRTFQVSAGAGGMLFLGPLLMILFRRKYPRWWFDWNVELQRFGSRVVVFLALMDDRYPSTDERQSVRLDYVYPDVPRELNRWLPLVKWLLAVLRERPQGGYELLRELEQRYGPAYRPSPGSIYPALAALRAEQLVEPMESGRRTAFAPTPEGRRMLADQHEVLARVERRTGN